jgi:hypothetical protein
MGSSALQNNNNGSYNTAGGQYAMFSITTGNYNAVQGYGAGFGNNCASGAGCTLNGASILGYQAGYSLQTGADYSTLVGYQSGYSNTTGGYNVALGYQAGYSNQTGSGNVFIGKQAGYNETGSNKLYIANSNTATPLLYGDFAAASGGALTVNGTLAIKPVTTDTATLLQLQNAGGTPFLTADSSTGTLTVKNVVITAALTVNGHIISGNSSGSTTAAAGATAGTGATVTITGNDTSGKIVITTGTGAGGGDLADITFAQAYGSAPNVVLSAGDTNAAKLQSFVSPSTTTFSINAPAGGAGLADSTSYTFYYHVMQ